MEGGGWCPNELNCLQRSSTDLGSSKNWKPMTDFAGFLSDVQEYNPDFYQWNVVYIKYCDGASFAGYV